jgi:hypothetical protein
MPLVSSGDAKLPHFRQSISYGCVAMVNGRAGLELAVEEAKA